jgi:uncharacterized protein (TIGR01777 family)
MRIVIAGGSGFLGQALTQALVSAGHRIQILTRQTVRPDANVPDSPVERINWMPDGDVGPWARLCAGADAVINLAGESIGSTRWSNLRKAQLITSRLLPTRSLVTFMKGAEPSPALLVSSSAIGYYGDCPDQTLTEASRDGADFLAELCVEWEKEAARARSDRSRVVLVRTGIVLDPHEGALAKMLTPFRLFAGGPFGSGRQYMSWIHRDDWVSLVAWAVATPHVDGPLNATSPHPVSNAEFARSLGRALRRPALLPVPSFVLRLILGEMAGPLLLHSQRVVPARPVAGGFRFAHDTLDAALADLLPSPR